MYNSFDAAFSETELKKKTYLVTTNFMNKTAVWSLKTLRYRWTTEFKASKLHNY